MIIIIALAAAAAAVLLFKKDGGFSIGGGNNLPTYEGINAQVQGMLKQGGVSMDDGKICVGGECFSGSGQDIQRNSQSNSGRGGNITQRQSHSQKSTVFFTIPSKFGNL